jgi:hypothetical protein
MSVGVPADIRPSHWALSCEVQAVACRVVAETVTENSNDKSRDCNPCNRYLDLTDADQCVRGRREGFPCRSTSCVALSDWLAWLQTQLWRCSLPITASCFIRASNYTFFAPNEHIMVMSRMSGDLTNITIDTSKATTPRSRPTYLK